MTAPDDFLMAEYQFLKELRESQVQQGQIRINIYVILISSAVALVTLITNDFNLANETRIFSTGMLVGFGLFYLGYITLKRIIQTHIQATRHTRAINLIRRYFVEKHPNIKDYLYYPTDEKKPHFGVLGTTSIEDSGLTKMTIILNIFSGTVGISSALLLLVKQVGQSASDPLYQTLLLLAATATAIMIFRLQRKYVQYEIQAAKNKYDEYPALVSGQVDLSDVEIDDILEDIE